MSITVKPLRREEMRNQTHSCYIEIRKVYTGLRPNYTIRWINYKAECDMRFLPCVTTPKCKQVRHSMITLQHADFFMVQQSC